MEMIASRYSVDQSASDGRRTGGRDEARDGVVAADLATGLGKRL